LSVQLALFDPDIVIMSIVDALIERPQLLSVERGEKRNKQKIGHSEDGSYHGSEFLY
jgi:hypothetical protein